MYRLHEFVPNYKEQSDEKIQWETSLRQEFHELGYPKKEIFLSKEDKNFFNHQNLMKRFFKIYDRGFIIHETGTGKSGSVINLTEHYKNSESSDIRRAIIIQPNKNTLDDFKNQIIKLTPYKYEIDESQDTTVIKGNITRQLEKFYSLFKYHSFASYIDNNNLTDEEIIEEFSDCIFFLDEAHKLRNYDTKEESDYENIYNALWRVFHLAQRTKILIASATPMMNKVSDFVPLINLLLPNDSQLPLEWDFEYSSIEQLEPHLRGFFSHVRQEEKNITVEDVGETFEHSHELYKVDKKKMMKIPTVEKSFVDGKLVTIGKNVEKVKQKLIKYSEKSTRKMVFLEMSDFQTRSYMREIEETGGLSGFGSSEKQATLFVFPDGSYGVDGYTKFIKEVNGRPLMKQEFAKYFDKENRFNNLRRFGVKYFHIITNEMKKTGCSFVFSNLVNGSGLRVLWVLLEKFGFSHFRKSITSSSFMRDGVYRIKNMTKKKRFAVITGTDTFGNDDILNIFNSPDNIDGEYVQILIGSETLRDGVNISNVVRGYMLTPHWHESGIHQAMSRFIRATSHDALIEKYGNIKIKRYYTAAYPKNSKNEKFWNSIDIKIYLEAERKDLQIRPLFNIMKQLSFDGLINYERNFDKFELAMWDGHSKRKNATAFGMGPTEKEIIHTTQKIYYYQEIVKSIKEFIIINTDSYILDIKLLFETIKKNGFNDEFYIYQAIDDIIKNKINFFDIFGNQMYLQKKGKSLFITFDFPYLTDFKYSPTTNFIVTVQDYHKPIDEKINEDKKTDLMKELRDYFNKNKSVTQFIIDQTNENKKVILEEAIISLDDAMDREIVEDFAFYIVLIEKEPVENLKKAIEKLYETNKGKKGKPRGVYSSVGLKNFKYDYNIKEKGEKIFLHFFKGEEKNASYNIGSIFHSTNRTFRIYKKSEGVGFRDAKIEENYIYNLLSGNLIMEKIKPYTKKGFFGSYIIRDRSFRIHDSKDAKTKGRVCETTGIDTLVEIFAKIIELPESALEELKTKYPTKKDVVKILRKNFMKFSINETKSHEQLLLEFFIVDKHGLSKKIICESIKNYLEIHKRLIRIF